MPEQIELLPPVLSLLLNDNALSKESPDELRASLSKSFLKDLQRQAEGTGAGSQCYLPPVKASGVSATIITPSEALNPMHSRGKCTDIECRLEYASAFARSVGLMADSVTIPDPFTPLLMSVHDVTQTAQRLHIELQVFRVLQPLFAANILRFSKATAHYCAGCYRDTAVKLKGAADHLTDRVVEDGAFEIFSVAPGACEVAYTAPVVGDGLIRSIELSGEDIHLLDGFRVRAGRSMAAAAVRRLRSRIRAQLLDQLLGAVISHRTATENETSLATFSRIDALLLSSLGNDIPNDVHDWEGVRSLRLPHVSSLTPAEVVQLREQASSALRGFDNFSEARYRIIALNLVAKRLWSK